jgi:hypothetical protein
LHPSFLNPKLDHLLDAGIGAILEGSFQTFNLSLDLCNFLSQEHASSVRYRTQVFNIDLLW